MKIFSLPLVRYVLIAAVRDKLVVSLLLLLALGSSISLFLGSASASERFQFSLVFAAGSLRIVSILGLALFIVFYIRRSFDSKDIEYLLTRPISRICFIFSHSFAFSILAALFGVLVSVAIFSMGWSHLHSGYYLWSFSMITELIIMANAAMFFAMVVPNASAAALSVFALYVLSRLVGQLLGIADSSILDYTFYAHLSSLMDVISLIIPRIDLMSQTSWLVYNGANIGYGFIALQGILYTLLLVYASLVDLVRRQF